MSNAKTPAIEEPWQIRMGELQRQVNSLTEKLKVTEGNLRDAREAVDSDANCAKIEQLTRDVDSLKIDRTSFETQIEQLKCARDAAEVAHKGELEKRDAAAKVAKKEAVVAQGKLEALETLLSPVNSVIAFFLGLSLRAKIVLAGLTVACVLGGTLGLVYIVVTTNARDNAIAGLTNYVKTAVPLPLVHREKGGAEEVVFFPREHPQIVLEGPTDEDGLRVIVASPILGVKGAGDYIHFLRQNVIQLVSVQKLSQKKFDTKNPLAQDQTTPLLDKVATDFLQKYCSDVESFEFVCTLTFYKGSAMAIFKGPHGEEVTSVPYTVRWDNKAGSLNLK